MKPTATGVLGSLAGLVGLSVVAGLLVTMAVTPAIAVSGAATSNAITVFNNLPKDFTIEDPALPTTLFVNDAKTNKPKLLATFYDQNRVEVSYDNISPLIFDALLSSEDPRFYKHGAIDMVGTARAVLSNVKGDRSLQGGSSISQQYVKNALVQKCYADVSAKSFEDDPKTGVTGEQQRADANQKCYYGVTSSDSSTGIQRKLQEMKYAIQLEKNYSKQQILVHYLNIANFGGTTYGIEAAAMYYFGVHAKDVTLEQAATLAGMVKEPNFYRIDGESTAYDKKAKKYINNAADGFVKTKDRRGYVLGRMVEDKKITKKQAAAADAAPITPHITPPKSGCANATPKSAAYYCDYVVSIIKSNEVFGKTPELRRQALRQGGLKVYTTLDERLQNAAKESLTKYTPKSSGSTKWSFGAVIVNIENGTGRVLSMAQNTDYSTAQKAKRTESAINYSTDFDHGGSVGFAPGSTFKLFTLLDWVKEGHSLREVADGTNHRFTLTNSCGPSWAPQPGATLPGNHLKEVGKHGYPIDFTRTSLNTGFFGMAEKLDMCSVNNLIQQFGIKSAKKDKNGNDVPITMRYLTSIIGNGMEVAPLAMGNAFASVAAGGKVCEPIVIDRVTDSKDKPMDVPKAGCHQAKDEKGQDLDPAVAGTAIEALKTVMHGGGTASQGNPNDGTDLMGKTGTNEATQSWLIQASPKVTTAFWSGVVNGLNNRSASIIDLHSPAGGSVWNARADATRYVQRVVDKIKKYQGGAFPAPDPALLKKVKVVLPDVTGLSPEEAQKALTEAGFDDVAMGPAEPSATVGGGLVARTDPPAGEIDAGTKITLFLSNGQAPVTGVAMPDVRNTQHDAAKAYLQGLGFDVGERCVQTPGMNGEVIEQDPEPGAMVDPGRRVRLKYGMDNCPPGSG